MAFHSACVIVGCKQPIHAKGFCRRHYKEFWQSGKMGLMAGAGNGSSVEEPDEHEESDRVRALERELRRAEMMYNNVIGLEGRLKWQREIKEVKREMRRLGIDPEELCLHAHVLERQEVGAAG